MSTKKSNESRIADHLNALLKAAEPVHISDTERIWGGDEERRDALSEEASRLAQRNRRAVDLAEIAAAARERRPADLDAPEFGAAEARRRYCIPWPHTRRLHVAVNDQVVAMIARSNQDAQDEYERYRLACEQGVAVPPTT